MSTCGTCGAESGDVAKFCPACGTSIVRVGQGAGADEYIGRTVDGKFRVESVIGEGGMGRVYKATQLRLDKTVCLKILRKTLLGDERTVRRFQREAKAASKLNHPNSISVIDSGATEDGALYIAMEYVQGRDLHEILAKEWPLPDARVGAILAQVLSALSDAHAAGIIHRDLKPENIMVDSRRGEDVVKVLDFGIAKMLESDGDEGTALTRAGFVCGTPEYMSPEQARGGSLDARSDLYAVGVILYQCCTGLLPFDSESAVGYATLHLTAPPIPPRKRRPEAQISPKMEALILRALAKNPDDRPQSAEELRVELLDAAGIAGGTPPLGTGTGRRSGESATQLSSPPWSGSRAGAEADEDRGALDRVSRSSGVLQGVAAMTAAAALAAAGYWGYRTYMSASAQSLRSGAVLPAPSALSGQDEVVSARPADPSLKLPFQIRVDAKKSATPAAARAPESDADDTPEESAKAERRPNDPARAHELVEQGDKAFFAGDVAKAIDLYTASRKAHRTAVVLRKLGMCYLRLNDRAEAHKWLRRYVKSGPSGPEVAILKRHLD